MWANFCAEKNIGLGIGAMHERHSCDLKTRMKIVGFESGRPEDRVFLPDEKQTHRPSQAQGLICLAWHR